MQPKVDPAKKLEGKLPKPKAGPNKKEAERLKAIARAEENEDFIDHLYNPVSRFDDLDDDSL